MPAGRAAAYVERLVAAYLGERSDGETFQAFAKRKSDEELISDRDRPARGRGHSVRGVQRTHGGRR